MEVTDDWIQRCERRERYMLTCRPLFPKGSFRHSHLFDGMAETQFTQMHRGGPVDFQGFTTVT